MNVEGRPYRGLLYAGLILTIEGPRVLEFNVRFGAPECQPLVMRLKSDLLTAMVATSDGQRPERSELIVKGTSREAMEWIDGDVRRNTILAATMTPASAIHQAA